jgi:hypothetical protein
MRVFVLSLVLIVSLMSGCKHRDFDNTKLGSRDAVGPEMASRDFDAQRFVAQVNEDLDSPQQLKFAQRTACVDALAASTWTLEIKEQQVWRLVHLHRKKSEVETSFQGWQEFRDAKEAKCSALTKTRPRSWLLGFLQPGRETRKDLAEQLERARSLRDDARLCISEYQRALRWLKDSIVNLDLEYLASLEILSAEQEAQKEALIEGKRQKLRGETPDPVHSLRVATKRAEARALIEPMIPLLEELTKPGVAYNENILRYLYNFLNFDKELRRLTQSSPEAFPGLVLPFLAPSVLRFRETIYDDKIKWAFDSAIITLPSVLSQLKTAADSLEDRGKKSVSTPTDSQFILACAGNAL